MKYIKQHCIFFLTALMVALSFASCEDEDDWYAEQTLQGSWRISEITWYKGECPYYEGDRMEFFSNGELRVYGNGDFYETGYWDVHGGRLYVDFGHDGTDDIVAKIASIDWNYIRLDVTDYTFDSRYTLRMVKR